MKVLVSLFWHLFCSVFYSSEVTSENTSLPISPLAKNTRRILKGNEVENTRPYMVYLRAGPMTNVKLKQSNWLCGGVIIHSQYILTSAACIENVQQFYVVSGTHRWMPPDTDDECVKNGAKRAVWKCVPKDYVYDGEEFDNIRWMMGDVAVVKVEDDFNLQRRVRGCDFAPKLIAFNNQSEELEAPGTAASVAGWGSTESFGDTFGRSATNSPELLESDVVLMARQSCARRWPERYRRLIQDHMLCSRDGVAADAARALCRDQDIKCQELVYSDEDDRNARRSIVQPKSALIHSSDHSDTRRAKTASGGFCENDHGGPLVVGHGKGSIVIGVMAACMTANYTQRCHGPFLYTSVWKNRHLISCAIDKDKGAACRQLLRSQKSRLVETNYKWPVHTQRHTARETSLPQPQTKLQVKHRLKRPTTRRNGHINK